MTGTEVQQLEIALVFAIVYLGMFLGGLPQAEAGPLGRGLLGAIAMIALVGQPIEEAARGRPAHHRAAVRLHGGVGADAPGRLLHRGDASGWAPAAVAPRAAGGADRHRGVLSAVFSNDIICLAMTPVVARLCLRRGLDAGALPDRAGLCGQHRLGRHADRQPAEHADRLGAEAGLWRPTCAAACRRWASLLVLLWAFGLGP
jgi:hypothetical protein